MLDVPLEDGVVEEHRELHRADLVLVALFLGVQEVTLELAVLLCNLVFMLRLLLIGLLDMVIGDEQAGLGEVAEDVGAQLREEDLSSSLEDDWQDVSVDEAQVPLADLKQVLANAMLVRFELLFLLVEFWLLQHQLKIFERVAHLTEMILESAGDQIHLILGEVFHVGLAVGGLQVLDEIVSAAVLHILLLLFLAAIVGAVGLQPNVSHVVLDLILNQFFLGINFTIDLLIFRLFDLHSRIDVSEAVDASDAVTPLLMLLFEIVFDRVDHPVPALRFLGETHRQL